MEIIANANTKNLRVNLKCKICKKIVEFLVCKRCKDCAGWNNSLEKTGEIENG